MNALIAFDCISIGVDVFIAFWFAALSRRGASPILHGPVAALAALIAASHAASAFTLAAPDAATAARGQDLFEATMLLAAAAFVDVASTLAHDRRKIPTHAWWFCGVFASVALTGLNHDPALPSSSLRPLVSVAPLGLAALAGALVFCGLAAWRLVRAARTDASLRPLVGSLAVPIVLSVWDLVARLLELPFGHVSGTVRSVFVAVLAALLLRRLLEVERALERKTAELAASTARLSEAQAELDRTEHLAAVGELSAVIAHEIKNPLAALANAAATLKKGPPEEDAAQLLRILDEEADRLNRLVDDVLVYARPLTPQTLDFDLRGVVTNASRLALDAQPSANGIVIDWDARTEPQWIYGDATLIRHALVNILDNAILAMPAGGTIAIRMRPSEVRGQPGVAVEFHDEGEGMDTQVRARASEPFFTTRESGTGLGLAIVDRVARVHGGAVTFASRAGSGTTVTFAVPLRARTSAIDVERSLHRDSTLPFPVSTA